MSITKILTDKLSAAFAECGYSAELGTVVTSDRPDLCQFQCNGAFAGAKLYHKAPRRMDIHDRLRRERRISSTFRGGTKRADTRRFDRQLRSALRAGADMGGRRGGSAF